MCQQIAQGALRKNGQRLEMRGGSRRTVAAFSGSTTPNSRAGRAAG